MTYKGCPLCGAERLWKFHHDGGRPYMRCASCGLMSVPAESHLPPEEEKKRYDLHENSPDDPGYRSFLSRLIDPMLPYLTRGSRGLDFGSGPGPALSLMMRQRGFDMVEYDPFYSDDKSVLEAEYDFITCSETAEHFREPRKSWDLITSLVRPGGVIGVMTDMFDEGMNFSDWHYIRDDTHVAFYSKNTFEWIAGHYDLSANFYGRSVVIMNKP